MATRITVSDRAEAERIIDAQFVGACLVQGTGALQFTETKRVPFCWTGPEDRAALARITTFQRLMAAAQNEAWIEMRHVWTALGPEVPRGPNLGVGRLALTWHVRGVQREQLSLAFILPDVLPFLNVLVREHTFLLFGALPASLDGCSDDDLAHALDRMDGLAVDLGGDVRDLVMTVLEWERLGARRGGRCTGWTERTERPMAEQEQRHT
jgi:hypothetical protein